MLRAWFGNRTSNGIIRESDHARDTFDAHFLNVMFQLPVNCDGDFGDELDIQTFRLTQGHLLPGVIDVLLEPELDKKFDYASLAGYIHYRQASAGQVRLGNRADASRIATRTVTDEQKTSIHAV